MQRFARGYRRVGRTGCACLTALAIIGVCCLPVWVDYRGSDAAASDFSLIQPRIFNGVTTFEYPFVGALLRRDYLEADWQSRCTLTLIGPSTALTAAHCVCPTIGTSCQIGGRDAPDPGAYRVFLQNAGVLEIVGFGIPSTFSFPYHDFAVLHLAAPVEGIQTVPLAPESPPLGSTGEIIGFGSVSGSTTTNGIKRTGTVHTTSCDGRLSDALFLCWETVPDGTDANTCPGDSGAPLLVATDDGEPLLSGIASGGYGRCDGEDLSFHTAVAAHLGEVDRLSGGSIFGAMPGGPISAAATDEGLFSPEMPAGAMSIAVPDGTSRLAVTANALDRGGNRALLRLRLGSPPTGVEDDCLSNERGVFEACIVPNPPAGIWYASYEHTAGLGGDFQLSATAFNDQCGLDVDGNGRFDALTDGLLVVRFLEGYQGDALSRRALGIDAVRTSPEEIAGFLGSVSCIRALDVDANGLREAATDGELVLRYLFGFAGDALVAGAIGEAAARTSPDEIRQWLDRLLR